MSIIENNNLPDEYVFDTNSDGFPIFTQKNLWFLQALIENDSKYRISNDKFEYSYAGLLKKHGVPKDRGTMEDLVKSIDKFNSTHLASEGRAGGGNGIAITVKAILKIENLEEKLKNKDDSIVTEIARAVNNKINFSFATKFCAYTSIGAFKQDNYCIYDTVVQNILPYYIHVYLKDDSYYRTNRNDKNCSTIEKFKTTVNYKGYRELIDRVIDKIEEDIGYRISYKDFDNLLWYYYKGDKSRIDRAMSLLPTKNK